MDKQTGNSVVRPIIIIYALHLSTMLCTNARQPVKHSYTKKANEKKKIDCKSDLANNSAARTSDRYHENTIQLLNVGWIIYRFPILFLIYWVGRFEWRPTKFGQVKQVSDGRKNDAHLCIHTRIYSIFCPSKLNRCYCVRFCVLHPNSEREKIKFIFRSTVKRRFSWLFLFSIVCVLCAQNIASDSLICLWSSLSSLSPLAEQKIVYFSHFG